MSKPTASAAGAALPASVSLAQFSRDPILRNALKLSAADASDSFAVSTAITPELIAAYGRWLYLERSLLWEEGPGPRPITKMPPTAGLSAELRLLIEDQQRRELRLSALLETMRPHGPGRSSPVAPVDRYFITASSASTRAALVLSAVGCDWRA